MAAGAIKNARYQLIKAVFARAEELGIDQETLRDTIVPAVIHKRLSAASAQEIARVIEYITRRHQGNPPPAPASGGQNRHPSPDTRHPKRYESSRSGLLEEIKDIAIARFGQDFVRPLNALCERFRVEGYRSLRVNQAKAVKATLVRLQAEDPRGKPEAQNPKSETTEGKVISFRKGEKGFLNQLGELDRIRQEETPDVT